MNMSSPDALEAVEHIYQALLKRWPETRIEPSLDRIAALCDALGSPERTYPVVHIAGTNGKTTTSRMIDSIFSELGYRTGRFTLLYTSISSIVVSHTPFHFLKQ